MFQHGSRQSVAGCIDVQSIQLHIVQNDRSILVERFRCNDFLRVIHKQFHTWIHIDTDDCEHLVLALLVYGERPCEDHERRGAELARTILARLDVTTEQETDVICAAIRNHDGKAEVDGPLDEILKDADVIDHSLSDPTKEVKAHEAARFGKLCAELGFADA